MTENERQSFPMIPATAWWALRGRFEQTIPKKVDDNYLHTVLSVSKTSAKNNIIPALKTLGIIDSTGKPTDLARRWRDDTDYPAVCEKIRAAIYPRALLDIAPDASADREEVKRWFSSSTGAGINAVGKMTSLFMLLTVGDPEKTPAAAVSTAKSTPKSTKPQVNKTKKTAAKQEQAKNEAAQRETHDEFSPPSFHVNVQVHISPDTSPEQIDAVFASMAKHFKELRRA